MLASVLVAAMWLSLASERSCVCSTTGLLPQTGMTFEQVCDALGRSPWSGSLCGCMLVFHWDCGLSIEFDSDNRATDINRQPYDPPDLPIWMKAEHAAR